MERLAVKPNWESRIKTGIDKKTGKRYGEVQVGFSLLGRKYENVLIRQEDMKTKDEGKFCGSLEDWIKSPSGVKAIEKEISFWRESEKPRRTQKKNPR